MILIADSGSTKTDWLLAEDKSVVKRVNTQGINPFHQKESEIRDIITNVLLRQLGDNEPTEVFFYGSGCRAETISMLENILKQVFKCASQIEVYDDLLGAARAVCGSCEGIACILGTGSNSCLYDGSKVVQNTPPLGYILGDEGSGAVLGINFINALYKGRLSNDMRDIFLSESGFCMADIIRKVYREPMANRFLASLSTFIHRHISDEGLRALVIDNFRNFFRNNVLCYGRPELTVGVVGSIGYYFSAELSEAAEAEGLVLDNVVRSPLEGLLNFHTMN